MKKIQAYLNAFLAAIYVSLIFVNIASDKYWFAAADVGLFIVFTILFFKNFPKEKELEDVFDNLRRNLSDQGYTITVTKKTDGPNQ